jgi:hypothetical protein
MPSLEWLGRRWTAGSDEFVAVGFLLSVVHATIAVIVGITLAAATAGYTPRYDALASALTATDDASRASWSSCASLSPAACGGVAIPGDVGVWSCLTSGGTALVTSIRDAGPARSGTAAFVPPAAAATGASPPPGDRVELTAPTVTRVAPSIQASSLIKILAIGGFLGVAHAATATCFLVLAFFSSRGSIIEGAAHPLRRRVPSLLTMCLALSTLIAVVLSPFLKYTVDARLISTLDADAELAAVVEDAAACLAPASTVAFEPVLWAAVGAANPTDSGQPHVMWALLPFVLDIVGLTLVTSSSVQPSYIINATSLDQVLSGGSIRHQWGAWRDALAAGPTANSFFTSIAADAELVNNICSDPDLPSDLNPAVSTCALAGAFTACLESAAPCRGLTQLVVTYRSSVEWPIRSLFYVEIAAAVLYFVLFIVIPFDSLGQLTSTVSADRYHKHWVSRLYCAFCCMIYCPRCRWGGPKKHPRDTATEAGRQIVKQKKAIVAQYRRQHYRALLEDVALSAVALFQNLDLTTNDIVAASVALGQHQRALRLQRQALLSQHQYSLAAFDPPSGAFNYQNHFTAAVSDAFSGPVSTGSLSRSQPPMLIHVSPSGTVDDPQVRSLLMHTPALAEDAKAVADLRTFIVHATAAYGWQQRVCYTPSGCTLEVLTRLRTAALADAERISLSKSLHRAAVIELLGFNPKTSSPFALLSEVGAVVANPNATEAEKAALLGPGGPSGILYSNFSNDALLPSFYVAVDRPNNAVVIAIRGTNSVSDILTDIVSTSVDMPREEPDEPVPPINVFPPPETASRATLPSGSPAASPSGVAAQGHTSTLVRAESTTRGAASVIIGWQDVHGHGGNTADPEEVSDSPTRPGGKLMIDQLAARRARSTSLGMSTSMTGTNSSTAMHASASVSMAAGATVDPHEGYRCHRGMHESARAVLGVLRDTGVLYEIACHVAICDLPLVVTGHSLGGGVAAILAYTLRQLTLAQLEPLKGRESTPFTTISNAFEIDVKAAHDRMHGVTAPTPVPQRSRRGSLQSGHAGPFATGGINGVMSSRPPTPSTTSPPVPTQQQPRFPLRKRLRVVAYASPGGLYTRNMAEACAHYTVAMVRQDDVVPRLSPNNLRRLRRSLVHALVASKEAKESLIGVCCGACCCSPIRLCCANCTEAQSDPAKGELPPRIGISAEAHKLVLRMTTECFETVGASAVGLHPPVRTFLLETAAQPRSAAHAFPDHFHSAAAPPVPFAMGHEAARAGAAPDGAATPGATPTAAGLSTVVVVDAPTLLTSPDAPGPGPGTGKPAGASGSWCLWPLHRLLAVSKAAHGAKTKRPLRDIVVSPTMISDHLLDAMAEGLPHAGLPTALYVVLSDLDIGPLRRALTTPHASVVLATCELFSRLSYRAVFTVLKDAAADRADFERRVRILEALDDARGSRGP